MSETLSKGFYAICELTAGVIDWILSFLPDNPFSNFNLPGGASEYLGWVNWILPIGNIIKIITAWVGALVVYYLYNIIYKWIKAVNG